MGRACETGARRKMPQLSTIGILEHEDMIVRIEA
jgi:hypothetical protein